MKPPPFRPFPHLGFPSRPRITAEYRLLELALQIGEILQQRTWYVHLRGGDPDPQRSHHEQLHALATEEVAEDGTRSLTLLLTGEGARPRFFSRAALLDAAEDWVRTHGPAPAPPVPPGADDPIWRRPIPGRVDPNPRPSEALAPPAAPPRPAPPPPPPPPGAPEE